MTIFLVLFCLLGNAALDQYLVYAYIHLLLLGLRRARTFSSGSKCLVPYEYIHLCACVSDICRGVQRCACLPPYKVLFVNAPTLSVQCPPRILFSRRYCYNSTLAAFKKANPPQWQKAVALLAQMKEDDALTPNLISYTTAVQACLAASESAAAESLVKEMVLAGYPPADELKSLVAVCASVS